MKKSKKKKLAQRQQEAASIGSSAEMPLATAGGGYAPSARVPRGVEFVELPETAEPLANRLALPVLLIALLGLLVYGADMFVMNHGGQFNAQVYYPNTSVPGGQGETTRSRGKIVYNSLGCAACHQPNGQGSAALGFPPLAGSEWVLEPGPSRIIRVVLDGLTGPIEVKGQQFNNTMVPWRDTLSAQQIADVLSYIRNDWGNSAPDVTLEQVEAVKTATADRAGRNWTAPELLAVPPQ